jgi:hypothetical protein
MNMRVHFLPLTWLALIALVCPVAVAKSSNAVVVELFTSQGCSSCPPADRLLAELAKQPDVIAISRPVTYWDRLGWKDTLARPENTQLQYDYASRMGKTGVYTPQAVVNGRHELIGTHGAELRSLIGQTLTEQAITQLVATRQPDGRIKLKWAASRPANMRLHVIGVTPQVVVKIGRGENSGRQIIYTNVVRDDMLLTSRFDVTGHALLDTPKASAKLRYAVLADTGVATAIVAAAWVQ